MASTYLNKTFASSGNRKTFTISTWFKRSGIGTQQEILSSNNGGSDEIALRLTSTNELRFYNYQTSGLNFDLQTNQVLRDTSAWYHVVLAVDTTQATSSNRIKIYLNGEQITSFSSETYPNQNIDLNWNMNNSHNIGYREINTSEYFDGSLAHFHNIDGTAYDADTFGETDATTGIWKPKTAPSVTYGTNGFFLKFENSGAFGTDSSGNANNFTVNGTMTQTIDTPSNVFATANALDNNSNSTYSNGNTTIATGASEYAHTSTTLGVSSGKYYCEAKYISGAGGARIGVAGKTATSSTDGLNGGNYEIYYENNGNLDVEGTLTSSWGSTYTTGDIIGIGLDLDNNKIYFSKNGTWQNSADPSAGTGGETISSASSTTAGVYFFSISDNTSSGVLTVSYNFGNGLFGTTAVSSAQNPDDGIGIFEFSPPTGYKSLCTKSINSQEYD